MDNGENMRIDPNFKLLNFAIPNLNFENGFYLYQESDPDLSKNINVDSQVVDFRKDEDQYFATATVSLELEVSTSKDEQKMQIAANIIGSFSSGSIEENAFDEMVRTLGCSTLYSILSNTLSSFCSQAVPGDRIILPFVRFEK